MGEDDRDFKWNNYISRFHSRHIDLMDLLAGYQNRAFAPLDDIAQLCGLPGKLGMDGSKVWQAWREGKIEAIRDYCETDVANTYLLFLRFQRCAGRSRPTPTTKEVALFRAFLARRRKRRTGRNSPRRGNNGRRGRDRFHGTEMPRVLASRI